ncbi:MAG: TonB-dependent receptor, partial [Phycisphaerae bacterium]|nr:TonB-dependent receptor [Phycisphaerae bacterium]
NIEKAATSGLEGFVRFQPAASLTAKLSYTYTDTEARDAFSFGIADGSRLLRRPLHKFAADLTSRFWDQRAAATLSAQYVGARDDLDPVTFATVQAGSYFVVNLRGAFQLSPDTEIFAGINNLLDETYQDVLGFNGPGLNAYGGVTLRF